MTELLRTDSAVNKAKKFIDEVHRPILDDLRPEIPKDDFGPEGLEARIGAYLGLLLDDADRYPLMPEMRQMKDDVQILVRQFTGETIKYKTTHRRNLRSANIMKGLALRAGELTNELLLSDEYRAFEGIQATDFMRELIHNQRINENVGVGALLALSARERSGLDQKHTARVNELIQAARKRLNSDSRRLMRSTESFAFNSQDPMATTVKDQALREGERYLSLVTNSPYYSIEDLAAQKNLVDSLRRPVNNVGRHVNARIAYFLDKLFPNKIT